MPIAQRRAEPLFCFSHVQKAGGTTVEAVMRRHFGARHMLVNPPRGWIYRKQDLESDLRLNPWARSIGSHWLRPFVNFGDFEERLVWYIFLREPISRFLSQYQYHVDYMGVSAPFTKWMNNSIQHNWQTRFLAGELDVEAAKQILATRYRSVGILERFNESLLLAREALGTQEMKLAYGRPHNPAKPGSDRQEMLALYGDDCVERNQLDLELYDFVVKDLYPKQVRSYGEDRLERDLTREFIGGEQRGWNVWIQEASYFLFRRAVHLPVSRIRRVRAQAQGVPDIRR